MICETLARSCEKRTEGATRPSSGYVLLIAVTHCHILRCSHTDMARQTLPNHPLFRTPNRVCLSAKPDLSRRGPTRSMTHTHTGCGPAAAPERTCTVPVQRWSKCSEYSYSSVGGKYEAGHRRYMGESSCRLTPGCGLSSFTFTIIPVAATAGIISQTARKLCALVRGQNSL